MTPPSKFCNICLTQVNNSHLSHVRSHHIKTNIFNCSKCEYGHPVSDESVMKHINSVHRRNGRVIFINNQAEEDKWLDVCFPFLKEAIAKRQEKAKKFVPKSPSPEPQPSEPQPPEPQPSEPQPSEPNSTPSHQICKLCNARVETKRMTIWRHVRKIHMKKPLHSCSECEYSSLDCRFSVKAHIGSVHLGKAKVITNENREEYYMWRQKCFNEDSCETFQVSLDFPEKPFEDSMPEFDKKFCQLCKLEVKTHLSLHIRMEHLKKPMYSCSQCSYQAMVNKQNVYKHAKMVHGGSFQLIVTPNKEEFLMWKEKCFGPVKVTQKKERNLDNFFCFICQRNFFGRKHLHIRRVHHKKPYYSCSVCGHHSLDNKTLIKNHIKTMHVGVGKIIISPHYAEIKHWAEKCFGEGEADETLKAIAGLEKYEEEVTPDEPSGNVKYEKLDDDFDNIWRDDSLLTCQVCKMEVPSDEKDTHIRKYHIQEPLYLCPSCDYYSPCNRETVVNHIQRNHGTNLNVIVKDDSEELAEWKEECFGEEKLESRKENKYDPFENPASISLW